MAIFGTKPPKSPFTAVADSLGNRPPNDLGESALKKGNNNDRGSQVPNNGIPPKGKHLLWNPNAPSLGGRPSYAQAMPQQGGAGISASGGGGGGPAAADPKAAYFQFKRKILDKVEQLMTTYRQQHGPGSSQPVPYFNELSLMVQRQVGAQRISLRIDERVVDSAKISPANPSVDYTDAKVDDEAQELFDFFRDETFRLFNTKFYDRAIPEIDTVLAEYQKKFGGSQGHKGIGEGHDDWERLPKAVKVSRTIWSARLKRGADAFSRFNLEAHIQGGLYDPTRSPQEAARRELEYFAGQVSRSLSTAILEHEAQRQTAAANSAATTVVASPAVPVAVPATPPVAVAAPVPAVADASQQPAAPAAPAPVAPVAPQAAPAPAPVAAARPTMPVSPPTLRWPMVYMLSPFDTVRGAAIRTDECNPQLSQDDKTQKIQVYTCSHTPQFSTTVKVMAQYDSATPSWDLTYGHKDEPPARIFPLDHKGIVVYLDGYGKAPKIKVTSYSDDSDRTQHALGILKQLATVKAAADAAVQPAPATPEVAKETARVVAAYAAGTVPAAATEEAKASAPAPIPVAPAPAPAPAKAADTAPAAADPEVAKREAIDKAIARAEKAKGDAETAADEARNAYEEANNRRDAIDQAYKTAGRRVRSIRTRASAKIREALRASTKATGQKLLAEAAYESAFRAKTPELAEAQALKAELAADRARVRASEVEQLQAVVFAAGEEAQLIAGEVEGNRRGFVDEAQRANQEAGKAIGEVGKIRTSIEQIGNTVDKAEEDAPRATKKLVKKARKELAQASKALKLAEKMGRKAERAYQRAAEGARDAVIKKASDEADKFSEKVTNAMAKAREKLKLAGTLAGKATETADHANNSRPKEIPLIYMAVPHNGTKKLLVQGCKPITGPKTWQVDPLKGKMLMTYACNAGKYRTKITLKTTQDIDTLEWSPWTYKVNGLRKKTLPTEPPKGLLVYFKGRGWRVTDIKDPQAIKKTLAEKGVYKRPRKPKGSKTFYSRFQRNGDKEVVRVPCAAIETDGKKEYPIQAENGTTIGFGTRFECKVEEADHPFHVYHMTRLGEGQLKPDTPNSPMLYGYGDWIWIGQDGKDLSKVEHYTSMDQDRTTNTLQFKNDTNLLNQFLASAQAAYFPGVPEIYQTSAELTKRDGGTYTAPLRCETTQPKPKEFKKKGKKKQTATTTCEFPEDQTVTLKSQRTFSIGKVDRRDKSKGTKYTVSPWKTKVTFPGQERPTLTLDDVQKFTVARINDNFETFTFDASDAERLDGELQTRFEKVQVEKVKKKEGDLGPDVYRGIYRGRSLEVSGGLVFTPGAWETTTPAAPIDRDLPPDVRARYERTQKPTKDDGLFLGVEGTLTARFQPEFVFGSGLALLLNAQGGRIGDETVFKGQTGLSLNLGELAGFPLDPTVQLRGPFVTYSDFEDEKGDVEGWKKSNPLGQAPMVDFCLQGSSLFGEQVTNDRAVSSQGLKVCVGYNPNLPTRTTVDDEGVIFDNTTYNWTISVELLHNWLRGPAQVERLKRD